MFQQFDVNNPILPIATNPSSWISHLESILLHNKTSQALFTDLCHLGNDLRNVCVAADDSEGDETMRDKVNIPGGAMGDGDDDGNGVDDGGDDDDDPEFDWTGLEENVPYVGGAFSFCQFLY